VAARRGGPRRCNLQAFRSTTAVHAGGHFVLQRIVTVIFGAWLLPLPVFAQTSAERVRANLDAQYQIMKRVVSSQFKPITEPPTESFDMPCIGGDPVFHSKDPLVWAIGALAGEMVQANLVLAWAQYPPSVWQDSLANIERRQLDRIGRSGRFDGENFGSQVEVLLKKLQTYADSHPKLAKITWDPACGGHGTELKVVTRPRGLSVQYLEALYYTFCTSQSIDPRNSRVCNLWNTIRDGESNLFEGAYWYRVKRNDGSLSEPKRKDFSSTPETATRWVVSDN
jgi:hypothetical protein